jgi:hypothetical protein
MTAVAGPITGHRVLHSLFLSDGHIGRGIGIGGRLITHGTTGVTQDFTRLCTMFMLHFMATDMGTAYTITDFTARDTAGLATRDMVDTNTVAMVGIPIPALEDAPWA